MLIRPATPDDWQQIWPFFDGIVRDGQTYAYPDDLDSAAAEALWTRCRPGSPWSP